MEVALELGLDGKFDLSASKLALNEKRLPRSISDRSARLIREFHKMQSALNEKRLPRSISDRRARLIREFQVQSKDIK
jgi:hypothetical protein